MANNLWTFVLLLCILHQGIKGLPFQNKQNSLTECMLTESGVYVAISSEAEILKNGTILRWIQANWWGISNQTADDFVGIWDHDPIGDISGILDSASASGADGGATLDIRWDGSEFPTDIPTSSCLPYWAGYVQGGEVIYSDCLKLQPNWMMEIYDVIKNVGIADVLLPGTHDAGAYGSSGIFIIGDNVGKWTFTQDETLWQQMVLGARYADMRVSYYDNTTEKFFISHGDVRIRPLVPYLNDVSSFLNSTNEIFIFDIHEFTHGFDQYENAKPDLTDLLISYFGPLMAPHDMGPNPTLDELWSAQKRIIITYPENSTSNLIWENVHHLWGNVDDLNNLYDYMSTNIPLQTGSGSMWSAMTEFTPSTLDVTFNKWGGLRGAASITNKPVTLWLQREWWTMVNIIAMDFIASSNVINVVIEGNKMRAACNTTIKIEKEKSM